MTTESMNGNRVSGDENKEVMQRDELAREEVRQEASALVKRVAEGYSTLRSLMEQNPWLTQEMDAGDRERKRAFDEKLQQGLRRANDAPRCRWVRQDGTSCGSPQMRNQTYCYAHRQMMEARALALRLPAAEDANSIQMGLMRIQKALIDDTISTKKAGLLLYSMQLAMTNVGQTTFGKAADDDLSDGYSGREGSDSGGYGCGDSRADIHAGHSGVEGILHIFYRRERRGKQEVTADQHG